MALYENLFESLTVGPIQIKNRVVRSPHGTGLAGEDLIAYHEARAKGGVGMSTIQATGVHKNAPSGIPIYSDNCKPFLTIHLIINYWVGIPNRFVIPVL